MGRGGHQGCWTSVAGTFLALTAGLFTQRAVAEHRHFSVPAGEATETLVQFGQQADRFVSYDFGRVEHKVTRAIDGDFEIDEALRRMLEGSGLEFQVSDSGSMFVSVRERRATKEQKSRSVATPAEQGPVTPVKRNEGLSSVYVRAFRVTPALPTDASIEPTVLTREDIARSGDATVVDLLRPMTSNFGGGPTEDTQVFGREAGANPAFGSGINLRGLGSRATLVLVNGHRIAPSGSAGTFFDVSNIPLSAVEQVQVFQDGNATLLGGDAIGGVVNFVLRESTDAPRTQVSVGSGTKNSLGERLLSQSLTKLWDSGSLLVAGEYYDRDPLYASQRAQATSDLTPWGGSNFGNPAGNPGTLVDVSGDGSVEAWGLPKGQNGVGLTSSKLTAGPSLHDRWDDATVLPHQRRYNLMLSGQQRVADDWNVWVNALGSRRLVDAQAAGVTAALAVPSTNPWYFNPGSGNAVQVLYGFGADLGPQTLKGQVDTDQFALGFEHPMSESWDLAGYVSYAGERQSDRFGNMVDFAALEPYLASSDPATAFNAFGDGSHTNRDTLDAIRQTQYAHYSSRLITSSASASGRAVSLPAGDLKLTTGVDFRAEVFKSDVSAPQSTAPTTSSMHRRMFAFYAQGIAPLLAAEPSLHRPYRLQFHAGVRDEFFSDVGHAFGPRVGLSLWATPDIGLRVGWERLFRAPNLADLSEAGNISSLVVLPDATPSAGTNVLVWTGGNGRLKPETARSLTASFTLSPNAHPEAAATVTYFHTLFDHMVVAPDLPETALLDPQYDWLVRRSVSPALRSQVCSSTTFIGMSSNCLTAPIGALVDVRLQNAETLETDGLDFTGHYDITSGIGRVRLGLESTYVLRYALANSPTAPIASVLSTTHYPPALRARGTLGWEGREFWVSTALNYTGGYENTDSLPHRPVSPWATWDMSIGCQLKGLSFFSVGHTQIVAAAKNLFNHDPPFLNNAIEQTGYDQENADLYGRRASLSIQMQW